MQAFPNDITALLSRHSRPDERRFSIGPPESESVALETSIQRKNVLWSPSQHSLQQARANPAGDFDPMNATVPNLVTMTKAALNVLDDNGEGFAVMIEGGAVDWAGHANQLDRVIEEQVDFNNAVQAVVDYFDSNTNGNNWSNTLLIVTADHETGHRRGDGTGSFFGVDGDGRFTLGVDYAHIADNGK